MTDAKIMAARRFNTKLWNAARYVVTNGCFDGSRPPKLVHPINRWMLGILDSTARNVTTALERFAFASAARLLCDSFRSDFCSRYIEATKSKTFGGLAETRQLLGHAIETYLRLLHPFIPYVTEELWNKHGHKGLLMQQAWPATAPPDADIVQGVGTFFRLVKKARHLRSRANMPWKTSIELRVFSAPKHREMLELCVPVLTHMTNAGSIEFTSSEFPGAVAINNDLWLAIAPIVEVR